MNPVTTPDLYLALKKNKNAVAPCDLVSRFVPPYTNALRPELHSLGMRLVRSPVIVGKIYIHSGIPEERLSADTLAVEIN